MKYLDKQIEKVIKTKQRAIADLIDCQNNLAKTINSHCSNEPKFILSKSDLDRYMRECNEYYDLISKCDVVITELNLLKAMNEDL